jgi:hypothetical protein
MRGRLAVLLVRYHQLSSRKVVEQLHVTVKSELFLLAAEAGSRHLDVLRNLGSRCRFSLDVAGSGRFGHPPALLQLLLADRLCSGQV